jgi:hypothetical protein
MFAKFLSFFGRCGDGVEVELEFVILSSIRGIWLIVYQSCWFGAEIWACLQKVFQCICFAMIFIVMSRYFCSQWCDFSVSLRGHSFFYYGLCLLRKNLLTISDDLLIALQWPFLIFFVETMLIFSALEMMIVWISFYSLVSIFTLEWILSSGAYV